MKIPKCIEKLLDRRAKLAADLMTVDGELTEWIDENHIEVEACDYCTGCEMYVNPYESVARVKEAIRKR